MKRVLDPGDSAFLNDLHRWGAETVQGMSTALGVTATAVRQRLFRLQNMGLITRELQRNGRGRPSHVYQVSPAGLRELGDNYGDLARILWKEVNRIPDPQVREQLTLRIRDALATLFGPVEGRSLAGRVNRLRDLLRVRGYDVETDGTSSLPILRENSCPFHELADADRGICDLERDVFQRILGAEVTLTNCCRSGHHCCEFEISESKAEPELQFAPGG